MSGRFGRLAPWLAFAGSFAVYLIPLVDPHSMMPLGLALLADIIESSFDRPLLWTIANYTVAIALQAAAFGLLLLLFRRPGWLSGAAVLLAAPILVGAVQVAYLLALPIYFLIESEFAAETGDWPVDCAIEDGFLSLQRRTALGTLEHAGEAWLRMGQNRQYARMTAPDCQLDMDRLSQSDINMDRAAPGGAMLYRRLERSSGTYSHWYLPPRDGTPIALRAPGDEKYWAPTLSSDGRWVAWLKLVRDSRKAIREVRIIRLDPRSDARDEVTAQLPLPASLRLQAFDAERGIFIVVKNSEKVFGVGTNGEISWGPVELPGFRHLWDNFRLIGDGWVTWDSYRENGRYRVAWSLAAGDGLVEIPRGRGIGDVSLQPGGGLIAVSVSGNSRIGIVRDSVFVVRTDTGQEVYRRFLPANSRPHIAFLGPGHLAVGRYQDGRSGVELLAVPAALQQPRE